MSNSETRSHEPTEGRKKTQEPGNRTSMRKAIHHRIEFLLEELEKQWR